MKTTAARRRATGGGTMTSRVRSTRSTGVRKAIDEMVRRIVKEFDPEQVILFGSHARGTASPDSDVDLLVVLLVRGSKRDKQLDIRAALHDVPLPKDIIVTTPDDFAWRKDIVGTIERPAVLEGKVLYSKRTP